MVQIDADGHRTEIILGSDIEKGHQLQVVVSHGIWQGTKLVDGGRWALLGCTVSPSFEFEDFVSTSRADLTRQFPQHASVIENYTRG